MVVVAISEIELAAAIGRGEKVDNENLKRSGEDGKGAAKGEHSREV